MVEAGGNTLRDGRTSALAGGESWREGLHVPDDLLCSSDMVVKHDGQIALL